ALRASLQRVRGTERHGSRHNSSDMRERRRKWNFRSAHCDSALTEGDYKHVNIVAPTIVTGSNNKTESNTEDFQWAKFEGEAPGGVQVAIQCKSVSSTGTLENQPGPPMNLHTSGVVVTWAGCLVTKPEGPKGTRCEVEKEEIKSRELEADDVINGAEMGVRFK